MTDASRRRIALWCAVSTPEQATVEKDSLPSQESDGREWANALSADVVRVYSVPGHSRKYRVYYDAEADMDAYRQLRLDCEAQAFDVLWCRNRNRLGRTLALIAQVDSFVREVGMAEVYSAAMPHQLGKQTGRSATLLAAVEGWQAQADNEERAALAAMGMKARIRRGMMGNHPPLGYLAIRNRQGRVMAYEFDEGAGAVLHMTGLFLAGHSYQEVARRMNHSGYRPQRSAGQWSAESVYKALHNDTYGGFPHWGRVHYEGDEPSPHYPALWDADTYRSVVRERERRRCTPHRYRTSGPFHAVAFCNRCRAFMVHQAKPAVQTYRCSTHVYYSRGLRPLPCHANTVTERKLIVALGVYLAELRTDEAIEAALGEWKPDHQPARLVQELDELGKLGERLGDQRKRLALDRAAGTMDAQMYRQTDDALLAQLEASQEQAIAIQRQLDALPDRDAQRDTLRQLASGFHRMLAHAEPAEVSRLLQDAGLRIWCEEREVVGVGREM